jgi:hypothetical protein
MSVRSLWGGSGVIVTAAAAAFGPAAPAPGGIVNLGANWTAEWDSALDDYVNIETVSIGNDTIFIQKTAEFIQPPVNGAFPSIDITFRQTGMSAINHIAIFGEEVLNSTGVEWTGFHFILLDSGDAVFNPVLTAASGGPGPIGWNIDPFTQGVFGDGNRRLDVFGGVIDQDQTWTPGGGKQQGQLWIDVFSDNVDFDTVFTLKETPTPGAGTLAAMLIGGLSARRRRRA